MVLAGGCWVWCLLPRRRHHSWWTRAWVPALPNLGYSAALNSPGRVFRLRQTLKYVQKQNPRLFGDIVSLQLLGYSASRWAIRRPTLGYSAANLGYSAGSEHPNLGYSASKSSIRRPWAIRRMASAIRRNCFRT